MTFPARTLSLAQASLYLYSDGLSEAVDASGAALGVRGLARLIARASRLPPASRVDSIVDAIAATPAARRDDITLAVLDPNALH
jgi:serine phosphatase RsbU (regulator of sigma subunit)